MTDYDITCLIGQNQRINGDVIDGQQAGVQFGNCPAIAVQIKNGHPQFHGGIQGNHGIESALFAGVDVLDFLSLFFGGLDHALDNSDRFRAKTLLLHGQRRAKTGSHRGIRIRFHLIQRDQFKTNIVLELIQHIHAVGNRTTAASAIESSTIDNVNDAFPVECSAHNPTSLKVIR